MSVESDANFALIRRKVLAATDLDPYKHQRDPEEALPQVVCAPHPAFPVRINGRKQAVVQDYDVVALDAGHDDTRVSTLANLIEDALGEVANESEGGCTILHCLATGTEIDRTSTDEQGRSYLHRGATYRLMTVRA